MKKAPKNSTKLKPQEEIQPKDKMNVWLNLFSPSKYYVKYDDLLRPSKHQKINNLKAERELDLHGMTWQEAQFYIDRFLNRSQQEGIVAVRIIHGKGRHSKTPGGVLKQKTLEYLARDSRVKKVSQAGYSEGQSGACHVIIKLLTI